MPFGQYLRARAALLRNSATAAMVRKVYGHLGQVRHRAKVVEYRAGQHRTKLGDRLGVLQAGRLGTNR